MVLNKRKISILSLIVLSALVFAMLCTEILASYYLSLSFNGKVKYIATEMGAELFGAYKTTLTDREQNNFIAFSGKNKKTLTGKEGSYTSITTDALSIPELTFYSNTIELYIFIKNIGRVDIVPVVEVNSGTQLKKAVEQYIFDASKGHQDIVQKLPSTVDSTNASAFISNVNTLTANVDYSAFADEAIVQNDTYFVKVKLSIPSDSFAFDAPLTITLAFYQSFLYDLDNENILSIQQKIDSDDTSWAKVGHNMNLSANATNLKFYTYSSQTKVFDPYNGITWQEMSGETLINKLKVDRQCTQYVYLKVAIDLLYEDSNLDASLLKWSIKNSIYANIN